MDVVKIPKKKSGLAEVQVANNSKNKSRYMYMLNTAQKKLSSRDLVKEIELFCLENSRQRSLLCTPPI
jgi:hypothetical protein